MKTLSTVATAAVLALVLSACGSDSDAPAKTVEDFHQSLQEEDYETFCDTLAPDLITPLEEAAGGTSCAQVMEQNGGDLFGELEEDADLDVVESTVSADGTAATVSFTVGENPPEELSLVKIDGEWKIGSLDEEEATDPEGS